MNSSSTSTPLKFTATDPLGRIVVLKESTFDIHIVGEGNRIEFVGQEDKLKRIIERPAIIVNDPMDNRERYYDIISLDTTTGIKPIMVVVDHSTEQGDVVTAVRKSRMSDSNERGVVYERS